MRKSKTINNSTIDSSCGSVDFIHKEQNISDVYHPTPNVIRPFATKLNSYFETYTQLTKLKPNINKSFGKLNGDVSIYLMQVPKDLNHQLLFNKEISLTGNTKLRINDNKYIFAPLEEKQQRFSLLKTSINGSCCIKRGLLCGSVKVHRYFKFKNKHNIANSGSDKIELPPTIKVRHPIFGDKYNFHIKLNDVVQRKLNKIKCRSNKHVKKMKKNTQTESNEKECQDEIIFKILNDTMSSKFETDSAYEKNRKKRKELVNSLQYDNLNSKQLEDINERENSHSPNTSTKMKIYSQLTDSDNYKKKRSRKMCILQNMNDASTSHQLWECDGIMEHAVLEGTPARQQTDFETTIQFNPLATCTPLKKESSSVYNLCTSYESSLKSKRKKNDNLQDGIDSLINKYCTVFNVGDSIRQMSKKCRRAENEKDKKEVRTDIINI